MSRSMNSTSHEEHGSDRQASSTAAPGIFTFLTAQEPGYKERDGEHSPPLPDNKTEKNGGEK